MEPRKVLFGRRRVLQGAAVLFLTPPILSACGGSKQPGPTQIGPWTVPPGTTLTPQRFAVLSALFDTIVPLTDVLAGSVQAHAPWYLDQLLGAFNTNPPRIYAGGPYSGRHGGADGFSQFQPLTRVEEIRWRTYLEGSNGIAEREFNGPVTGMIQTYEQNLDTLDAAAQTAFGKSFALLGIDDRNTLVSAADATFIGIAYTHAIEGTYSDPVYGGNFGGVGWASISFEGDRQPVGYTAAEMMDPNLAVTT